MTDHLRIHVLTADLPSFLVHRAVRDEFIDEKVAELYGTREDGSGFDWEAEDLRLTERDFPVAK
jgi:hypothetical protein